MKGYLLRGEYLLLKPLDFLRQPTSLFPNFSFVSHQTGSLPLAYHSLFAGSSCLNQGLVRLIGVCGM